MMKDISGRSSGQPLARFDRESSCWRTCAVTSLWDLPMSLATLPEWGMTVNGELFERPTPVRLTVGQEFSSLRFLKTPQASNEGRLDRPERYHNRNMPNTRFDLEDQIAALLPTPVVNDMGSDKTIEWWEAWTKKIGGHGGFTEYRDEEINWGKYNGAIRRWELVLNRAAPDPTISGVNGRPRLSPLFVEWMMGLPEGWVTGHGLSVAKELKALGNGVCPQQAFLALQLLIGDEQ